MVKLADYTKFPGTRFRKDSENSAEDFYETALKPELLKAKANNEHLLIDLDGTFGIAVSFLDQMVLYIIQDGLENNFKLKSDDEPYFIRDIDMDFNLNTKYEAI